jgi:N-6 DNA Methylase/TaqI-like C-terminal specificity domain
MRADNLSNWYEASLPARERKTRGHFSTPLPLVEDILDACGYTPERDLSRLRVLDPACGSGNFLVGAAKRLMAFGQRAKSSEQVIATSIQRNIWGFDPDPVACFLAEMHLYTTCTNNVPSPRRGQAPPLHIHQADALSLRWDENANIDLFLANPPYLAAKNNDLSSYRSMQGHGQSDSYLLFVQLALRVTRPHGWIGLVLPDPLLARINAHQTRQCLLNETTIHHLWHLAGVFTAGVGAVVIVAQKCTPKKLHAISWQRERWSTFLTPQANQPSLILNGHTTLPTGTSRGKFVAQSLLLNQPHAELRYLLTEADGTLVERLHNQFQMQKVETVPNACGAVGVVPCADPVPCATGLHTSYSASPHLRPLADFVVIRRGEEIGKNHPLLKEELPPAPLVSQPGELPHWCPVLRGGIDIRPYSPPTTQHWIPRIAIHKPLEYYFTPKLLIIKSMDRLQTTLDLHNHVVLQTLYMLYLRPQYPTQDKQATYEKIQTQQQEDELYFLLALLNSRLLQEYVYILHTAYKWVQPQIEQHVLAQLPIPMLGDSYEKVQIIRRARLLMQVCNEKNAVADLPREYHELYEEQERAICKLYTLALTNTNFPIPIEEQVS